MANLGRTFSAKKIDPSPDLQPLPEGDYHLAVLRSELVGNKSGEDSHIKLTLQVQDGPHRSRLLWEQITWENASEKAVEIGNKRLSAYARACGVAKFEDTTALHGIPFKARVEVREDKAGNEVGRIYWKDGPVNLAEHYLPPRPDTRPGAETGGEAAPS